MRPQPTFFNSLKAGWTEVRIFGLKQRASRIHQSTIWFDKCCGIVEERPLDLQMWLGV
jgi:hypothetical protein